MPSQQPLWYGLAIAGIFLACIFHDVSAISNEYCSSLNTAQTPANQSLYQSMGLCYNFCIDDWAFAILQEDTCWCSNDAPGITTSVGDCNFKCPGYPDDQCGSADGLFGYVMLNDGPSATVTTGIAASTGSGQPASSNAPGTTSSGTATSPPSSTWVPTPVTSLETVTGQVQTVTITPTVPPNSASLPNISEKSGHGGLSTGGVVGLTVGLVVLVALVSSIAYFCIRRRRKEKAAEYVDGSRGGISAGLGGPLPSRTMSKNSRYVLGTDGRQVVETWEPDNRNTPGNRTSRLMPVDPRLDPYASVYQRGDNKSRESLNTIRDDHDYSRRVHQQAPILRATNPDE